MTAAVCAAVGVSRATVHRSRAALAAPLVLPHPRPRPPRALSDPQQNTVLDVLRAPRFADQAPAEIYATLLDEGRLSLLDPNQVSDPRSPGRDPENGASDLLHPVYQGRELLAERPNEIWSWDITKLKGPAKWTAFHLYVILDIFSRRVVGWRVLTRETAALVPTAVRGCDPET